MAFGKGTGSAGAEAVRLAATLVAALALALLAWRGTSLLTRAPPAKAASPADAALAEVIAPVAGPGLTRLSVTHNAEGGRTLLILLDETASARIPELERIAPIAAGLIPERGDRLVIETVAFAPGLPGRPGLAEGLELGALAALVLLGGMIALMSRPAGPVSQPAAQTLSPVAAPAERPRDAARPVRVAPPAPAPEAAAVDLVRTDPSKAASVVRGWLAAKEDAS